LSFAIAEKSLVNEEAEMDGTLAEVVELGLGEVVVPGELEPPHAVTPNETTAAPATKLAALNGDFLHHAP
jgi:hypothetical protein